MRRSVFFLTPLIPLAVAACEDGPAQTFQPATGTLFNNGNTPAVPSAAPLATPITEMAPPVLSFAVPVIQPGSLMFT